MKVILLTLLISSVLTLQSQTIQKRDAAETGYANATLKNGQLNGYYINLYHYFNNNYSLGWGIHDYGNSSYYQFGAFARPSSFSLFEVYIYNRYEKNLTERFSLGASLGNGLLMAELKETSVPSDQKAATKESYMYSINPAISTSYKIFTNRSNKGSIWLKAIGGYRQAIGGSSFGNPSDFSGANFNIGLVFLIHR